MINCSKTNNNLKTSYDSNGHVGFLKAVANQMMTLNKVKEQYEVPVVVNEKKEKNCTTYYLRRKKTIT